MYLDVMIAPGTPINPSTQPRIEVSLSDNSEKLSLELMDLSLQEHLAINK